MKARIKQDHLKSTLTKSCIDMQMAVRYVEFNCNTNHPWSETIKRKESLPQEKDSSIPDDLLILYFIMIK